MLLKTMLGSFRDNSAKLSPQPNHEAHMVCVREINFPCLKLLKRGVATATHPSILTYTTSTYSFLCIYILEDPQT